MNFIYWTNKVAKAKGLLFEAKQQHASSKHTRRKTAELTRKGQPCLIKRRIWLLGITKLVNQKHPGGLAGLKRHMNSWVNSGGVKWFWKPTWDTTVWMMMTIMMMLLKMQTPLTQKSISRNCEKPEMERRNWSTSVWLIVSGRMLQLFHVWRKCCGLVTRNTYFVWNLLLTKLLTQCPWRNAGWSVVSYEVWLNYFLEV